MQCPQCNSTIQVGQRFCGVCGFKIDPAAAAPKAPSKKEAKAEAKAAEPAKPAEAAKAPKETGGASAGVSLIMVNPDGSAGDTYELSSGDNIIGKATAAEVFSRDPFLSPRHANFKVSGKNVTVSDLRSHNGVFVRLTEATELQHGDSIRIGQELLRFSLLDLDDPVVTPAADGTIVLGSNPMGAWGKLERISAPDQASFTFLLRGAEQVLGRERGDILFRDDGYVSGRHARIYADAGRYFVEDLKSSNGTFIRIRAERTLVNGSLVLIGTQPFRIHIA